jgi:dienelactone hydrolase
MALFASRLLGSSQAPPPMESFCENDTIYAPSLSPDGTMLAYLTSSGRDLDLALMHLDTGKGEILCAVDSHTNGLFWKGNDRILFVESLAGGSILRSVSPGQHALNSFPGYGTKRIIGGVVNWLPADPGHILVRTRLIGLMDVKTGEIRDTQPVESLQFVGPYVPDLKGVLRLRCIQRANGIELQHRQADGEPFVTAYRWGWSEPFVNFLGFSADGVTAYLLTHDEGDWGVVKGFNTATFQWGPPIARFDGGDIASALYSRDGSRLIGLKVLGKEGVSNDWLDEKMRHNQAVIDASLPGRRNWIESYSDDLGVFLIYSYMGSEPGDYYSLNLGAKSLVRLGNIHPKLAAGTLGETSEVEIGTRDHAVIHGILTIPSGGGKGPHPLILIPQSRFFSTRWTIRYDPRTQFLASRGYSVLKVDYRGAAGYGRSFEDSGRCQLAGTMPNDIEDAARWSVTSGYAREGRICIYGTDFGGTLALMGATYSPALYCCVINEQGEADLNQFRPDWNTDWLQKKKIELFIGDDSKALATRSPILALDRIRAPILNIYADPDHDLSWDRLQKGLKRAGKPEILWTRLRPSNDLRPYDYSVNYLRQVSDFLDGNLRNAAAN